MSVSVGTNIVVVLAWYCYLYFFTCSSSWFHTISLHPQWMAIQVQFLTILFYTAGVVLWFCSGIHSHRTSCNCKLLLL